MQLRNLLPRLLLASTATAQLLTQGNGNLPTCGQQCAVLTTAQSQCNGGNSVSLSAWSCFCQAVWTASGGALTTMCATSCTSPSDNTAIGTWYTNNCGSDNGASEHGGGNSGGTGTGSAASSSAAASNLPSNTASSGTSASDPYQEQCPNDWWSCHWKWIVMVVVVAIGLLVLGFGGRWLKKRHDRKKDRISESFNAGITTRGTPMGSGRNVNDSYISGAGDGRNSPSRTREAFMPYGYGYTRSESRLGSHSNVDRSSPLARGTTPVNDLEKNGGASEVSPENPNGKSRRVKVRERLMGRDSEK